MSTSEYPLSIQEEEAFERLGGFERCFAKADQILAEHGFQRSFFTSREKERIRRGRGCRSRGIVFHFDPGKSLRANIEDLLQQAQEVQVNACAHV